VVKRSLFLHKYPECLCQIKDVIQLILGEHVNRQDVLPHKSMAAARHGRDVQVWTAVTLMANRAAEWNWRYTASSSLQLHVLLQVNFWGEMASCPDVCVTQQF